MTDWVPSDISVTSAQARVTGKHIFRCLEQFDGWKTVHAASHLLAQANQTSVEESSMHRMSLQRLDEWESWIDRGLQSLWN